jgi:DNA-binding transcriptional LysR family regulator
MTANGNSSHPPPASQPARLRGGGTAAEFQPCGGAARHDAIGREPACDGAGADDWPAAVPPAASGLTEAGVALYAAVGRGLDTIEAALAELRQEPRPPALSIAMDFGFASFWLMPRLEALARALPGVEVRIVTAQNASHQARIDADVAIVFGVPGPGAIRLFAESVVPVCSPAFLARHRTADGAIDWGRVPLLDLEGPEPSLWLRWRDWFEASGLPPRRGRETVVHLNTYPLVVEAAMLGQGAALGWQPLLERHLASGALVAMAAAAIRRCRCSGTGCSRRVQEAWPMVALQPDRRPHTPSDRVRQPEQAALPKPVHTSLVAPIQKRVPQLSDTSPYEAPIEKAKPAERAVSVIASK